MDDVLIQLPNASGNKVEVIEHNNLVNVLTKILQDMVSTGNFAVNPREVGVLFRHPLTPQTVADLASLNALTGMIGGEIAYQQDTGDLLYYNKVYLTWMKIGAVLP